MNMFILTLSLSITAILMISTNGLFAIVAMMGFHSSGDRRSPGSGQEHYVRSREKLQDPHRLQDPSVRVSHAHHGSNFNRPCITYTDCQFDSGCGTLLWLSCGHHHCSCDHHWGLAYTPASANWALTWDAAEKGGGCRISASGPCGWDKGLQIECGEGHVCTNGRCRALGRVKQGGINGKCGDDLDCSTGLICARALAPDHRDYYKKPKVCLPTANTVSDLNGHGHNHVL
jgi:hypothetical protein